MKSLIKKCLLQHFAEIIKGFLWLAVVFFGLQAEFGGFILPDRSGCWKQQKWWGLKHTSCDRPLIISLKTERGRQEILYE